MGRRSLSGKVVVITGGARGIGAATGRALAARGAVVVIADLDGNQAKSTAATLGGSGHALDVTDHAAFSAFLGSLGQIDVLINNAGIMPLAAVTEEAPSITARQLEINLHAVIHGTRAAVALMRPRGSGHIVNVASAAGKFGFPNASTYCATKFGVVGFSEAVRAELRGSGIEVSCVMPGMVRTELISGLSEIGFLKPVTAETVALGIVRALEKPRFEVFVPRRLNALTRAQRFFPRAVSEWAMRLVGGDTALVGASASRDAYEARVRG
ncbi:SDR family oxidoreductase [Actinokineospora xionganensis]|uniref:SDR family oxidoreductase n=1 Tax=Actinokineospora xionganensis TaxID=2684470 RepID=A0ABR7KYY2_9PSEU|nr:SDR family oxidoreductase [Actinokineospora xionganensis]MBC6445640.1 SDR family oxidoreductase [Actinokineospora xionganensis]